ncbi:MAG: YggT family protein [Syntrophomonadaceae bacterium]|nr:YggT family protein [Syntrophomonadaceae bacterium]
MNLIQLVDLLFDIIVYLIIFRCILSFIRHDPYHPLIKIVYDLTEPILAPFRRIMRPGMGMDFSPLLAFLVLMVVKELVIKILITIVY